MELLTILLFSVGVVLFVWGALWLLLLMFQTSLWWGLSQILFAGVPGALFAVQHWRMARPAFQVWLFGLLILSGAGLMGLAYLEPEPVKVVSTGETREQYERRQDFLTRRAESPEPGAEPSPARAPGTELANADSSPKTNHDPRDLLDVIIVPEEVLKLDPALLRTPSEIRRYAQAIQLQERKLQTRRKSLDTGNAEELAEFEKDAALLRRRAQELKDAAIRFQQTRQPAADPVD